jgi:hypothetical protein
MSENRQRREGPGTTTPPETPAAKSSGGKSVARLLIGAALIAFAILCALAGFITWRITNLASGPLVSAKITQEFREYIPTVGPEDGVLETATANITETFSSSDSAWLFNTIPLGTNIAEIRVPAIYRYHIRLNDPWRLMTSGNVCIVLAPQFQPSLPPAIVTGSMEKSSSTGWARLDAQTDLDTLEQSITGELEKRANDQQHRNFVRQACRESVADFVRRWLVKEGQWRDDKFHQIVVVFPDETTNGTTIAPGTVINDHVSH